MRRHNSLAWRSFGLMACLPSRTSTAPSALSNRNLDLRRFSSGPWQLKQLSERIGRTSRLKSMVLLDDEAAAPLIAINDPQDKIKSPKVAEESFIGTV